jgi:mono/diheme cytochrome c family protein
MSFLLRLCVFFILLGLGFFAFVYTATEWKFRRVYDVPLVELETDSKLDADAGARMAKIVGCWAGCHGIRGEGGVEEVPGVRRVTAPPLGSVVPQYSDVELVRLILHGIKRDGRSAIGMSSYVFWSLGDADITNIIHFLRLQPTAVEGDRVRQIPFVSRLKLLQGKWWLSADQVNKAQPRWGNMPRTNAYERGRYLAAIVCAECHGADFRGDPLEGGPPLAVLSIYDESEFARLMKTGVSQAGVLIEPMSWLPNAEFTDRDIFDLYEFLTSQ